MDTSNAAGTAATQRFIETNGIRMQITEQGQGPLVLLCHGFPETAYAWRHQLPALAAAGYHTVAPDLRGYGQTDAPDAIEAYTLLHLSGDLVGLLDALDAERAVLVGHDWGANLTWNAALLRPDRFSALVTMSVPYAPRGPAHGPRASRRPTQIYRQMVGAHSFYQLYFQTPGAAEAELGADVRRTIRLALHSLSGDATDDERWHPIVAAAEAGMFSGVAAPTTLGGWISEADVDVLTAAFEHSGFRGGLNWYRNIDRNWELLAALSGAQVQQPTLFLWGDRDPILELPTVAGQIERLGEMVPRLRTQMLPGCGHWVQQERPDEVNAALLAFLREVHGG